MSLDFTGDSEIQMIKLKVPVLVTKRDYGMYEFMLPDLGPVNGGYTGLKLARKHFELMFKAIATSAVIGEITHRADKKEMVARIIGGLLVKIVHMSDKDGSTKAEEAKG